MLPECREHLLTIIGNIANYHPHTLTGWLPCSASVVNQKVCATTLLEALVDNSEITRC